VAHAGASLCCRVLGKCSCFPTSLMHCLLQLRGEEPPVSSVLILTPVQEARFGDYNAVVVEVSGEAFYTGTATFTVEEEDPLKHGFSFK